MIPSTKTQILTLLKRSGGATVDELAATLGLAPMTVRQHLLTLERDSLIDWVEVRRHTGRPHHVFRLTGKGEETFPRHFDRLAGLLLQEFREIDPLALVGLAGEDRIAVLLGRVADRLAEQYAPRVEGRTLEERVQVVTAILHEESGFAEWSRIPAGFEIRDLNCPYRRFLPSAEAACQWHVRFLSTLLGREIQWESESRAAVDCCRYMVVEDGSHSRQAALLQPKEL